MLLGFHLDIFCTNFPVKPFALLSTIPSLLLTSIKSISANILTFSKARLCGVSVSKGPGSHCTMCVQISEGSTMASDNTCPGDAWGSRETLLIQEFFVLACGKDTTNIQNQNTFLS